MHSASISIYACHLVFDVDGQSCKPVKHRLATLHNVPSGMVEETSQQLIKLYSYSRAEGERNFVITVTYEVWG